MSHEFKLFILRKVNGSFDCVSLEVRVFANGLGLCFDLLTRPKMPFKGMHRKEVTHSNGSYERKLRGRNWLMKWDEIKKIPLYSHRRTSELDDSYFRSMTTTQTIPKLAEVTHPGR